jgi:hypothetical protein
VSTQCSLNPASCSFLDKSFLALDPVRGRLYVSYTEFETTGPAPVELAVCDLNKPASPTCYNGSGGSVTGSGSTAAAPYFVVAPSDPNGCENEGAYPAVDPATGDVYVAYEHNWFTNFSIYSPQCHNLPTQNVMNAIPFSCLTLTPTSPCAGPGASKAVNITSMDVMTPPGYNRNGLNDFPRVAVSDPAGTVSMIWNDARQHAVGDIFLQSFQLGGLTAVQSQPVRLNSNADTGGWHFMPALRNADSQGNLDVSFYSSSSANTSLMNVNAVVHIDPRTLSTPAKKSEVVVTTGPSDWTAVTSVITPNFGDYTDNYLVGNTLYVAWSDGRLQFPNPFEDVMNNG